MICGFREWEEKSGPANPDSPLCDLRAMRSPCGPFHPEASVSTCQDGSSPAVSDIKRGNSPEYPDLSALGRIKDQDSIIGHQLSRTAVEKKQK
jgi:hypothetical protein